MAKPEAPNPKSRPAPPGPLAWAAVPLVGLAGCVDAIGWLRLQELFVGFISGTSTLLGIALAEGQHGRAAQLAAVLGLFAGGALGGAALGQAAGRSRSAVVLGLVAAGLVTALLRPGDAMWTMVPAMGALNTALPGVGGITFVTGALSRAAEGLVLALRGAASHLAWVQQAACLAALIAGATLGATLQAAWGDAALGVPAAAAGLAALVAVLRSATRPGPAADRAG